MSDLDLSKVFRELDKHFIEYITEQGRAPNNGWIRCINPNHPDRNPSMHIIDSGEHTGTAGYCFSCHAHVSILNAVHYLENKPITGIGFYEETLPYLCGKYGISYEPIKIDNKTRDMYQKRSGVRDAINVTHGFAFLGTTLNTNHSGIQHLLNRGITEETIKKFKIGVVNSTKEYLDAMKTIGYTDREWLDIADLARKGIFNPDAFIVPIYDDKSRPVGFVSRTTKMAPNDKGDQKYVNSINSDIYCKAEVLFNLNNYDADYGPLWIVEGYVDTLFLDQSGLKNVVALGSTALTEQHVDLLTRIGIKNVIICLDGDEGGRIGTRRAIEQMTPYQSFKSIRIVELPEGSDPDSFVREHGLDEFKKLAHPNVALSPFAWMLKHATFQDDMVQLAAQAIPTIAAEESAIKRIKMINELAKITGIPKGDIQKDVELGLNKESDKFIEELTEVNKYAQTALNKRKIRETRSILEEAICKIKNIEVKYNNVIDNRSSYDQKKTSLWNKIEHGEYKYGLYAPNFKKLEEMYDGIPYTTNLTLVGGKPSAGKCLSPETLVWTYDRGLVQVQELRVGDLLMGDDGTPRKILGTTWGKDKMYRVTQENGISYKCNSPHVLSLKQNIKGKGKIIDIPLNKFIKKDKTFQKRYKGYKVPINFEDSDTLIDPYFLGLWLGDGATNDVRIYNTDQEVVDYLLSYASKLKLTLSINNNGTCPSYAITKGLDFDATKFSLQQLLRLEGVLGYKNIPDHYIRNSRENRLQLLAGLLDSDGYYVKEQGYFEITQVNIDLIRKIKTLADTLGFRTNLSRKKTSIKKINFEGEAWRLNISGNVWEIPTKIRRKQAEKRNNKRDWSVSNLTIELVEEEGDYFGFELDGNGRFLLEDGTVTHNTTWLQALALDIVEANEDVAVFFMSIDDTTELMTFKMLAQRTGYSTSKIKRYQNLMEDEQQIIRRGWNWLDGLSKRFVMADATEGTTPDALEAHIEWFKKEFPEKKRLFFLDNFHKLTLPSSNKQKTDAVSLLSERVKELTRIHDTHIIMTTELRKMSENNSRPTPADLKDTVQLEYDADSIIMVHNDLQVKEDTTIVWSGDYGGEGTRAMPYLEVYLYKNKHTGKTGGLAYRLNTYNLQVYEDDYARIRALKSQNAGNQILKSSSKGIH